MSGMTEEQKRQSDMSGKLIEYKWACDKVFERNPKIQSKTLGAIISAVDDLRREYVETPSGYTYPVYPVERSAELIRVLKTAKTAYVQALMRQQQKDLEVINSLNDFVNDYCDMFDIEQLP